MDNFPKKIIQNVEKLTLQTIFKLCNILNHLNLSLNMRTLKKIIRENVGQRVQTVTKWVSFGDLRYSMEVVAKNIVPCTWNLLRELLNSSLYKKKKVLFSLIIIISQYMHYQIIMSYTSNIYNLCQLYLNETGEKWNHLSKRFKHKTVLRKVNHNTWMIHEFNNIVFFKCTNVKQRGKCTS